MPHSLVALWFNYTSFGRHTSKCLRIVTATNLLVTQYLFLECYPCALYKVFDEWRSKSNAIDTPTNSHKLKKKNGEIEDILIRNNFKNWAGMHAESTHGKRGKTPEIGTIFWINLRSLPPLM